MRHENLFASGLLVLLAASTATAQRQNYLDTPRIHIAGRFFADPSTVNNDPKHYDPQVEHPSPWQEPRGNHYWDLQDCTVRSVVDHEGQLRVDDPLVGATVEGISNPPAKLVDLDVYQQMVSTIHGFRLKISLADDMVLEAKMDPATLNGVWFQRVLPTRGWDQQYGWGSYGSDATASGSFQTLVRVKAADWPTGHGSEVLDQLRATSDEQDGEVLLSFRFVLDGYQNVPGHESFRLGRFVGCLGPGSLAHPVAAPGRRWLDARPAPHRADWYVPRFYGGPFHVDVRTKKLVLDLGNSLCQQTPGGEPVPLGDLQAVVRLPDEDRLVGHVDYSQFMYEFKAGLAEIDLSDEHLTLLEQHPLALVAGRDDIGDQTILAENGSGLSCVADQRVFRMTSEPDSQWRTMTGMVHVSRWGQPAADLSMAVDVVPVYGNTPGSTGTPGSPGNTFHAEGALAARITPTDEDGLATLTLEVKRNPFSRTPELDGQLYFVYAYPDGEQRAELERRRQEQQISVLVWSQYPVNPDPDWEEVRRLMAPYQKLYPGMGNRIDLTDRHSFEIFARNPPWVTFGEDPSYEVMGIRRGAIPYLLTRDMNDSRFMPVSRDLSPNKLTTILHWVKKLQREKGEIESDTP